MKHHCQRHLAALRRRWSSGKEREFRCANICLLEFGQCIILATVVYCWRPLLVLERFLGRGRIVRLRVHWADPCLCHTPNSLRAHCSPPNTGLTSPSTHDAFRLSRRSSSTNAFFTRGP